MSLSGKVILITGSSKGIGKAAALRVASEGASLVINYLSDAAAANTLVERIGSDRALAVQADVSKIPDLDRLVDAAIAKFGRIDVLILNAGILPMKDLEHTSEVDFDASYNLMVKGPYFLAQVSKNVLNVVSWDIFLITLVYRKPQSICHREGESSLSQLELPICRIFLPRIFYMPLQRERLSRWHV